MIITTFCISLVVAEGSLQFKYHWPFMKYTNCPFKPVLLFLIDVCVCRCALHIMNSKRQCFLCWLLAVIYNTWLYICAFKVPVFAFEETINSCIPPAFLVSLCCYSFPGENPTRLCL